MPTAVIKEITIPEREFDERDETGAKANRIRLIKGWWVGRREAHFMVLTCYRTLSVEK